MYNKLYKPVVKVQLSNLFSYPPFVLGSIEDNPDEFKLNVHNIFTVRLSRPIEFCQSVFTKNVTNIFV